MITMVDEFEQFTQLSDLERLNKESHKGENLYQIRVIVKQSPFSHLEEFSHLWSYLHKNQPQIADLEWVSVPVRRRFVLHSI